MLATVFCFAVGALAGAALLAGPPRPLTGAGGLSVPVAAVAGGVAALAFAASTLLHRRGGAAGMPRWQRTVSHLSGAALTVAFGAVTAMGVLLAAEVLAAGLRGLALGAIGGGLLSGVAAAVGGRLAFGAGIGLRTADLAGLLFGFLVIGTLFAMVTAVDPRWWEENFSQLGVGWAFNGTLVVAGLLVATVGAYIGRDLHRLLGDAALSRIATVVVLWAAAGLALAAVGLVPLYRAPVPHDIAAVAALLLFLGAAGTTALTVPGRPLALAVTSLAVGALVIAAVLLWWPIGFFPVTAVEAVVVGLGLLWMTTLVRVLAILAPEGSRPSARRSLRGTGGRAGSGGFARQAPDAARGPASA